MLLLAGTNPSKVAARLSLVDLLLVVLLSTGTSVSSSTDAITAATVALVRAFIIGDVVALSSTESMFRTCEVPVSPFPGPNRIKPGGLPFIRFGPRHRSKVPGKARRSRWKTFHVSHQRRASTL